MLLKVGEIVLKGGNRHHFERILQANIRRAVRDLGVGVRLWNRNGVMVLRLTGEHGPGEHGPGEHGPGQPAGAGRGGGHGPGGRAGQLGDGHRPGVPRRPRSQGP